MPFLPITKKEMTERGWDCADIIIVTGDAYVDHPSFGTAIVSRVLENAGFKVCIISQPRCDADYMRFGAPRLAFFVNSGNIDSMVAHYTAAKKRRSDDAYTPGGKAGARPDRAVIVYSKAIRRLFGDTPICIGGIEASLRRFAHYDYWDDKVRPSILMDSTADLLMYGMGERHVVEIAKRLDAGEDIASLRDILGTCYAVDTNDYPAQSAKECPSFEAVSENTEQGKRKYAESTYIQQTEHDAVRGKTVIQRHGNKIVVQNPPMPPLSTEDMDKVYSHKYIINNIIPAIDETPQDNTTAHKLITTQINDAYKDIKTANPAASKLNQIGKPTISNVISSTLSFLLGLKFFLAILTREISPAMLFAISSILPSFSQASTSVIPSSI